MSLAFRIAFLNITIYNISLIFIFNIFIPLAQFVSNVSPIAKPKFIKICCTYLFVITSIHTYLIKVKCTFRQ